MMDKVLLESRKAGDMARIHSVVKDFTSIRPGMNILLDYCYQTCESLAWKEIAKLNFEKDAQHLQHWLEKTITSHPPPDAIRAFWFGCNDPTLETRKSPIDLHITGSTTFDAEDKKASWAKIDNSSYKPDGFEAKSAVIPRIHDLLVRYEVVDVGGLLLCLGYAAMAVKLAFRSIDKMCLFGLYGPRPVAVGDEDGHFLFIDVTGRR